MFLYCSVSVSFYRYILVSVGMAHRPSGHGSTSPVGPFDAIPAFASFVAAHGADLLHTIPVEANAWAGDVGVERVNSRSTPGVLAGRDTTTRPDREFGPGGGSSEPLDPDSYVHLVNSSCDTSSTATRKNAVHAQGPSTPPVHSATSREQRRKALQMAARAATARAAVALAMLLAPMLAPCRCQSCHLSPRCRRGWCPWATLKRVRCEHAHDACLHRGCCTAHCTPPR